ncbi:MAG TPA: type II secretion system F family protein, partial [Actinomycetota bacterium]|nr:type II secretion system F family protein [Actinomycetota bacterium]
DVGRGRVILLAAAGAAVGVSSLDGARAAAAVPGGVIAGRRAAEALRRRKADGEIDAARRALPDVIDRLCTCVLAGMSVERALRIVGARTEGALGRAIVRGLAVLDVGAPRARAYALIAAESQLPEMRSLMSALARAERFGTSVTATLTAQAVELRDRARAAAEAEMRAAPVKMIFPLVLCFLPAFVLLTVAPIAVSAVRTLSGI